MEFSKQLQIIKLILIAMLILFAGISWLMRGDFPEALVTWGIAALGLSDAPYQVKSAVENKAKIESQTATEPTNAQEQFLNSDL